LNLSHLSTVILTTKRFVRHLQDTSKLQCVEDFLEGMLGKLKFE
jgi:hypothetical protein